MYFLRLLSYLPFPILYVFSDFIFFFTTYIVRYRRKTVRKNLINSFPDKPLKEIRQIEIRFYKNLCDYGVETLKLMTIDKDDLGKRMSFANVEIIEEYKQQGHSVLILAAHQFNWEWLLTSGSFLLPLPTDFVYQKVRSKIFNSFSLFCRTRFGAHPMERANVAREILKRGKFQRVLALLADQYPGYKTDKRYAARFLHQDTVFFEAAKGMALMTQSPVVFASVRKIRRGFYEATFERISEPPYSREDTSMIDNYVIALEKSIINSPAEWLWSHNRWKKRHLRKKQGK